MVNFLQACWQLPECHAIMVLLARQCTGHQPPWPHIVQISKQWTQKQQTGGLGFLSRLKFLLSPLLVVHLKINKL